MIPLICMFALQSLSLDFINNAVHDSINVYVCSQSLSIGFINNFQIFLFKFKSDLSHKSTISAQSVSAGLS